MEKNESENKLNFLSKFIISIKDFEKYIFLAAEKSSKAISHLLKLMLLFSLISSLSFMFKVVNKVNRMARYINENINELSYNSGILEISSENPIEIENENGAIQKLIIDTKEDINLEEYISKLKLYDNSILVLRDKIILKNNVNNGLTEFKYDKSNMNTFNKEGLLSFINSGNIYVYYAFLMIITIILLFLYFISEFFVNAISLALLGYLIGRINRMRIKISATFNIGIYALTLPTVLKLIYIIINIFTNIEIKYFDWMYTAIAYVYVLVAILMIKADFIDKNMQMMKIYEESKIKQEDTPIIEENKKDEDDTKEDKNKDKKDNKDKKNNRGEPQDPAMQE